VRTRFLHLVRHGHYDAEPERLTALGRSQADLLAQRLARYPIDAVISSTMPRAKETAARIHLQVPDARASAKVCLRENMPSPPRRRPPPDHYLALSDTKRQAMADRLERAWELFGKPPLRTERHDVLVCHGNVIRAMVCRALELGPGVWDDITCPSHCSLTTLQVRAGGARLVRLNETGHLPSDMVTVG